MKNGITKVTFLGGHFDGTQKTYGKEKIEDGKILRLEYFQSKSLELWNDDHEPFTLTTYEYEVKKWITPKKTEHWIAFSLDE